MAALLNYRIFQASSPNFPHYIASLLLNLLLIMWSPTNLSNNPSKLRNCLQPSKLQVSGNKPKYSILEEFQNEVCFNKNTLIAVLNAVRPSLNVRAGSFWVVSRTRYETNYIQYAVRNIQGVKLLAFPILLDCSL